MEEQQSQDLDFINLVTLVASTAAAELGDKKPGKPDLKMNLPRARQFINMLKTLQDRTRERLNVMEQKVLDAVLADLQARYVKAAGLDKEDLKISLLGRLAAEAYSQAPKKQP